MKALRFYGKDDLRIEQIEEPKCEPGKVKVEARDPLSSSTQPMTLVLDSPSLVRYLRDWYVLCLSAEGAVLNSHALDLHEYLGGPNLCATTPHPITGEKVPLTFGHEFSGVVEEIGEGVESVKVGDRVVVEPIIWCDSCASCKLDMHNACDKGGFVGLSGTSS